MNSKTGPTKALIARGIHTAVILTTDNAELDWQIRNTPSDNVEEILGDSWVPPEVGLYLFEGEGVWTTYSTIDGSSEPELEWEGTCRQIRFEEAEPYFLLEPPEGELDS